MVKSCAAFNCTNRAVKDTGLSFFRFPADKKRRDQWVNAVRRKDFSPTENSRLCSAHFSCNSYTINKFGATKLKKDAVPTVFDFPGRSKPTEMTPFTSLSAKNIEFGPSTQTNIQLRKKVKALQLQLKRRDQKINTMTNILAGMKKKDNFTSKPSLKMAVPMSTSSNSAFVGTVDRYKAVHIKSARASCDASSLKSKLELSLEEWKSQEMRAVWFFVSLEHADWVPVLAKNGFRFHHTREDEVAMVRWLAPEESRIPVFAHTLVGAGAVVIDREGRLLVVQERYQNVAYWKLPGGYVEPGENIPEAAMREVLEETNIKTEFRTMIGLRHMHRAPFGCSDIYFIVELSPLTTDIVKDQLEIEDCQWMEVETYLNHPNVHENNRLFLQKYLFSKEKGISINGEETLHPVTKAPQTLFSLGPRK